MDVYRRTVFQVKLRAHFPSCAKTDCEKSLIFSTPSLWHLRADICVFRGSTAGLNSCNKTRGVIKTVRLSGCQTQCLHTHTHYMRRLTLAVPVSQAEQGAHMFEGWLTPGRWFALGRLWSLNLFRSLSLSLYSLTQTHTHTEPCRHSGMLMCTDTKPLGGFSCWQTF